MSDHDNEPTPSRRKVLAKLGLAAGAAYMAPVMLSLSQAHASGYSGASAASAPSRSSGPSRASGPSRPGGSGGSSGGGNRPRRPRLTLEQWMARTFR
jgi:hypothetical protein